jgi:Ca-activated chloride channel family protein
MKDELDDIKQLLRHTPALKTNATAKQAAISLALCEFDKNNSTVSQGKSKPVRLNVTADVVGQSIFGRTPMKKYQLAIIGTFCALFVVLAIVPMQKFGDVGQVFKVSTDSAKQLNAPQPMSIAEKKREVEADAPKDVGATVALAKTENTVDEAVATLSDKEQADYKIPVAPVVTAVAPAKPAEAGAGLVVAQNGNEGKLDSTYRQSANSGARPQPTVMEVLAKTKTAMINQPATSDDAQVSQYHDQGRDKFKETVTNPLKLAKDEPVSTFSIDVDTASYSFVRGLLNQNVLPQKNAVRVEEFINYFPYQYQAPANKEEPFKANVSVFPTPWNKDTKLMHIGIKGYEIDAKDKPRANLVFLIDTSGSMNEPNKLPLLQNSLKMLLDTLHEDDSVAIVTYAGSAGVALPPTKVKDKSKISAVIDNLGAQGSTAGAEGIRQAYQLAEQNLDAKGINRVILATDGDFNVGITDTNELKSFVEHERKTGVTLSVLGFGTGNYNDTLMQTLAQNGNGNAAYIDNLNEARKFLVEEAGSTLFTIAKDVKIQVEFNPAQVAEYRLIGYETRLLNKEDFNNDKVDAGDIGSGHTVSTLYEITPVASKAQLVDESRYQKPTTKPTESDSKNNELAFVKIRYKLPDGDTSKLITTPVTTEQAYKTVEEIPVESRFATAVAAFGQLLRNDPYLKDFNYDSVMSLAEGAKGADKFGYRGEFINLVRLAKNAPALPPLK